MSLSVANIKINEEWDNDSIRILDVRLSTNGEAIAPENMDAIIKHYESALAPLDQKEIVGLLLRLKLMTAGQKQVNEDIELQINIYVEELKLFPADVVNYVLTTSALNLKFWPSWNELYEQLQFWTGSRIAVYEKLIKRRAEEIDGSKE